MSFEVVWNVALRFLSVVLSVVLRDVLRLFEGCLRVSSVFKRYFECCFEVVVLRVVLSVVLRLFEVV